MTLLWEVQCYCSCTKLRFESEGGMLQIIAYTGGWKSPSRVYRVQEYLAPLREYGIDMRECASWAGAYPPARTWLRPAWGVWNLLDRLPDVVRSYRYDLVFFQREMLSTYVTWEPMTKKPRVFDVDDAIWTHPRGEFAARLAGLCDLIICGNNFLAEQFSRWNPRVTVLPTPVNTKLFCPSVAPLKKKRDIIGWMGLPFGLKFLYGVERALAEVLRRHRDAVLRVVSSSCPQFRLLSPGQVEWIPWSREEEVRSIQEMTIGIMPLDDSVRSRGKCSYKMLLYMACGVPVVVTPVGMNAEVLAKGNVGFGAATEEEWIDNLSMLLSRPRLCAEMGTAGREVVSKHFSVETLVPALAKALSAFRTEVPTRVVQETGNSSKIL